MNQIKTGMFIAECRKNKNMTQIQLAEKLGLTDRAISKWECGKSLPDASIMLDLCKELDISVNELLTGERLEMKDYNRQAEENLLTMTKRKEETDKRLLAAEVALGIMSTVFLVSMVLLAGLLQMEDYLRIILIVVGFIFGAIGIYFCLRIEQQAGYYECQHCHHKYVPDFKHVLFAPHMGRTRYMKCPHCHKKSWQKKVVSGTDEVNSK